MYSESTTLFPSFINTRETVSLSPLLSYSYDLATYTTGYHNHSQSIDTVEVGVGIGRVEMAGLKIRNLTPNGLEFVRFEITGRDEPSKVGSKSSSSDAGKQDTVIDAFSTKAVTGVRPAGKDEVVWLYFYVGRGKGGCGNVNNNNNGNGSSNGSNGSNGSKGSKGTIWRTRYPSPDKRGRSTVLEPLSSSDGDNTPSSGEMTSLYLPPSHHLTIFTSPSLTSWMSHLPDSLPLSRLSIPGTHNSHTHHKALPSVRCQAVSITQQLWNGVRFLDIRVSVSPSGTALGLVHGAFPSSFTGGKYLDSLLGEVYGFLEENPGETVLVSLKREGVGRGTDGDLGRVLATEGGYCSSSTTSTSTSTTINASTGSTCNSNGNGGGAGPGGGKSSRWWTSPHLPPLGAVRGKCILIRRFKLNPSLGGRKNINDGTATDGEEDFGLGVNTGGGFGIDASSWPDNCRDGRCKGLRIQDWYGVMAVGEIGKKIGFVVEHLERAGSEGGGSKAVSGGAGGGSLYLNFLTGSNLFSAGCWPEKIAAKVNPAIVEYLCTKHGEEGQGGLGLEVGDGGTGVVITDWIGKGGDWDLIRCIVGMNTRLMVR